MDFNTRMRILHRYLGFFFAGIMAMYAISGVVLIFRDTNFLKSEKIERHQLAPAVTNEDLAGLLRKRELRVERIDGDVVYFRGGSYNRTTGMAELRSNELPYMLEKMTQLHKADTKRPLFVLNILFATALLFFVVSAFWMFLPKTDTFKKGMLFALAGLVLALVLIFV